MSPLFRKVLAVGLSGSALWAQQASIEPVRPVGRIYKRPYLPAEVPPVRIGNSERLRGLIRGGKLYITAQDAIAVALENNIDVEVARYSPITLAWRLERAEAGGALPGVQSTAGQASAVTSGQGVLGSQSAAGVNNGGGGGGARGGGNTTVSQVGPVTANLDPTLQETTTFGYRNVPQPNVVQSVASVLVQNQRSYSGSFQQGFLTGGNVTVRFQNSFLSENAASNRLNPSNALNLSVTLQHNLLRGRGTALNARNITVARANLDNADLSFRSQIAGVVVNVTNAYYGLASDYDDMRAKQEALEAARKFYLEARQRLDLGALAALDVTSAQNLIASSVQIVVASESAVRQRELRLTNLLSRAGLGDPLLDSIQIVPLDHINIPAADEVAPLPELVRKALANRTDLLSTQASLANSEVSAIGTRNGLLPSVQVFVGQTQSGLAGTPRVVGGRAADSYFDGGVGTALGQIARRNFPTENIGAFGSFQLKNGQAQADYAIEQLQFRQQQLNAVKDRNQVQVDVANAVVALRQARARYEAAAQRRILNQQLLDGETRKFSLGASTPLAVIIQQRDLATANAGELAAISAWQAARINLDQVTGDTLEVNHVALAEAKAGVFSRLSSLPAVLPEAR